jgi:hypothetical protein
MRKGLQNLDTAELDVLLESLENDTTRASDLLFPERPSGYEAVLQNINEWAINRKVVLENHANGRSHVAVIFEKVCHRIWQQLPSYVQRLQVHIDPKTCENQEDNSRPGSTGT